MQQTVQPSVILWYRVYCASMLVLYFLMFVGGIVLFIFRSEALGSGNETLGIVYAAALVLSSMFFGLLFMVSFFLPYRPGSWIYHLLLIIAGLPSCCCMPASVALLIYWVKPETQRYFGRSA
ncbi:MAG: hypothetical protein HS115_13960 [Spirochaetales bacterium]|nr:hypothetical protein [Spirochaetales bacterium]